MKKSSTKSARLSRRSRIGSSPGDRKRSSPGHYRQRQGATPPPESGLRALGLDLGGTKLLGCLVDERGRVLRRAERPSGRETGPAAALRLIESMARELAGPPPWSFSAVGLGFPGICDSRQGVARSSCILSGWREVHLRRELESRFRLPVVLDNDVNMALVAELFLRRRAPEPLILMVAIGTGIGGALAFAGKLWRGSGGAAGEIGNTTIDFRGTRCWCGRRGCLNTYSSGTAISSLLGEGGARLSEELARSDARAVAAVRFAADALGEGIANAMQLLDPSLVVLGGGVARVGTWFLRRVARASRAAAFPEIAESCRFESARAGYDAGAIGAALASLEGLGAQSRVPEGRARP